ncbi:MAG: APC family permease [Ferrimicrobium acidiphilum]
MSISETSVESISPGLRSSASLRRGAMNRVEAFTSSVAAIAPAISVLTVFGAIFAAAGLASPLVLLLAVVAFAFHINTVAEYNRVAPSPGFYVSYIARGLGVTTGTLTAVVYGVGELILLGAAIFGPALWDQEVIRLLTGYTPGWWLLLLIQGAIGAIVVAFGVVFSVRVIATLFALELLTVVGGIIAILVTHSAYIAVSARAFNPANIHDGATGFGVAFVLCILMFSGCSASAPMSDEMENPRHNIPIAVYSALAIAGLIFVAAAWAQVVGFEGNVGPMLKTNFPFITAAGNSAHWLTYLIYFSGITSGLGVTVATLNAASRLYFNMSRERLLPAVMGAVARVRKTPWIAIGVATGLTLLTMVVYTLIAGGLSYNGGYTGYGQIATLGTDLVIVVYILANVGLPFFYRRQAPELFSWLRHVLAPLLAIVLLAYPFWETIKPNQAGAVGWWWLVVVVLIGLGVVAGLVAKRRKLPVGDYESSEVMPDNVHS